MTQARRAAGTPGEQVVVGVTTSTTSMEGLQLEMFNSDVLQCLRMYAERPAWFCQCYKSGLHMSLVTAAEPDQASCSDGMYT